MSRYPSVKIICANTGLFLVLFTIQKQLWHQFTVFIQNSYMEALDERHWNAKISVPTNLICLFYL